MELLYASRLEAYNNLLESFRRLQDDGCDENVGRMRDCVNSAALVASDDTFSYLLNCAVHVLKLDYQECADTEMVRLVRSHDALVKCMQRDLRQYQGRFLRLKKRKRN